MLLELMENILTYSREGLPFEENMRALSTAL